MRAHNAIHGCEIAKMLKAPPHHFCAGAVAFLLREVPASESGFHLSWRWRVDAMPPPTDLAERGADGLARTWAWAFQEVNAGSVGG